jgi:hypothetical protein
MMNENNMALAELVPGAIGPDEARVTVTYKEGDTFDLPNPVPFVGVAKENFLAWAQETMRHGWPRRAADPTADLSQYSVEPVPKPQNPLSGEHDFHRVLIRPKTTYGC